MGTQRAEYRKDDEADDDDRGNDQPGVQRLRAPRSIRAARSAALLLLARLELGIVAIMRAWSGRG